MKNSEQEYVGKVFVVVRRMRRCLICDGLFTRTKAAEHALIACSPPTKESKQYAAYTDPCSPFLPPIESSSSPGQA